MELSCMLVRPSFRRQKQKDHKFKNNYINNGTGPESIVANESVSHNTFPFLIWHSWPLGNSSYKHWADLRSHTSCCLNAYHHPERYHPVNEFPGVPSYPPTVISVPVSFPPCFTPCHFSTSFLTFPENKAPAGHEKFSPSLWAHSSASCSHFLYPLLYIIESFEHVMNPSSSTALVNSLYSFK